MSRKSIRDLGEVLELGKATDGEDEERLLLTSHITLDYSALWWRRTALITLAITGVTVHYSVLAQSHLTDRPSQRGIYSEKYLFSILYLEFHRADLGAVRLNKGQYRLAH